MWNRKANQEIAAMQYGKNKSRTLAGLVADTMDVSISGQLTKGLDVQSIVEDEHTRVTKNKNTGKNVYKYRDDETDIFY